MKIQITTDKGEILETTVFEPQVTNASKNVLIINPAYGVDQKYYEQYARHVAARSFTVITYNYHHTRRRTSFWKRKLTDEICDYGKADFDAVTKWCSNNFADHSLHVLGHGLGGVVIGLTQYCEKMTSIITVASQLQITNGWHQPRTLYSKFSLFYKTLVYFLTGKMQIARIHNAHESLVHHVENLTQRTSSIDCPPVLVSSTHQTHFAACTAKLLSIQIHDDMLFNKSSLQYVADLFRHAQRSVINIYPEDLHVDRIGFFGFFLRHEHQSMWNLTIDWIFENKTIENRPYATWNEKNFPLVMIEISNRQATDEDAIEYIANMKRCLEKGPMYLLIDLSNVRWNDTKLRQKGIPFIRKNADLIRRNHRGSFYVAPNFFIRNVLAIFHRMEVDAIISPVHVFKNMEQALNWANRQMTIDKANEPIGSD